MTESPIWRDPADELQEQFYDWEYWGRGWAAWPRPVHLEPPFAPFYGHYVAPRPPIDDGRHETILSRVAAWFTPREEESETALALPLPDEDVRAPRYLEPGLPLRTCILHVPRERVVRPDVMAACLVALRAAQHPIAFELVGHAGAVAVQITVRERDEPLLRSIVQNFFPDVALLPGDRLVSAMHRTVSGVGGVYELGLAREFMLPLGTVRGFDPDPLIAFVAALEDASESEYGALQLLFEPARAPWPESIFRAVTNERGGDFFLDEPMITKRGKEKAVQPLFAVAIRVAVSAEDEVAARTRVMRIASALAQFEHPGGNHLFNLIDRVDHNPTIDLLKRQSHRSGMLLGLDELMSIVHLPSASVQSKALVGRDGSRTRPVTEGEFRGLFLGTNRHAGADTPVYLTLDRARRHVHIVGASGSGKSNLLLQLLSDHVRQGGGMALLDPHGDLVDDLLPRIPEERMVDVVLFDPADTDYPIGFNVLHAHSDLERTLLASDLVAIFRRLSTSWGDQMHAVLANAIQAFLESTRGGTIADLRRFLVDRDFRAEFLRTVPDEELVYFWTKEFPLLHGRPQGPILTRLDAFLRPKLVRQMVVQRENRIDFRTVMDGGKIFLAKLAHGAIGEENAALLGSFLLAKFHQTAMSRQDIQSAARRPFLLAADECQHFVTPSMAAILSGARKYALGLVLAHQDLTQLQRKDSEVFSALMANAGTRIVFRVGDADARALAETFAHFEAAVLRSLPTGEAICRFDQADGDFNLAVPLAHPMADEEATWRRNAIVATSRARYARPATPPESAPEPAPAPAAAEPPVEAVALDAEAPPSPAAEPKPKAAAPPTRGRGGPEHKYLQELVKRFAEEHGYRATIEKATVDGGSIDVALERADGSVAVEISVTSTGAYEAENVAKCLAAGYNRVVLLATTSRKVESLRKAITPGLGREASAKVEILLVEDFLSSFLRADKPEPTAEKVAGYDVKVTYRKPSTDDVKTRQQALADIVARSARKLGER